MRERVAILIAASALLIAGASPAFAAPGKSEGAGENRGASADHIAARGAHGDSEMPGLPESAKAWGKRIIDEYGMPFGHLQQCRDDFVADEEVEPLEEGEEPKEPRECPEGLVFPDEPGASAFGMLVFESESGEIVLGI
ncbi:MAG: hypothetical protein ABFR95_02500 [Actinomycetota bacterium]